MRSLPNAIAIARAAAAIPVVILIAEPLDAPAALVLFSVAALSDAVDGPLARRLGATTALGAFLDPLADKILILGTFIALAGHGAVDAWVVGALVGREALAAGLRALAAGRGLLLGASTIGKAKTTVQAVAAASLILALAVATPEAALASALAVAAAVALTVASGADLAWRGATLLVVAARAPADAR